ncbi:MULTISPECIES: DUF2533 family protein [Paenibacillus]|uniref:Uncharacterized protein n=1 Tax=Paenibacillus naphthalenovorans TaxID=162209 RepID=A0A0U2W0H8_9BACL|nr:MULTISPECIES: DUF2533 family protein [Paenibacillus]ALS22020.1 hypothetical protein IJ22_16460 [Paenibacillus naphthalenovorans]NTZ16750.1 DUF2533 family protein [Paenibacillus sp. JMULE4]GCL74239.1 DUF2533 domain-containing protein [Paenibacillus naphthalenovorans]SDJ24627.1 Protein of unknown function [Paenibacillus naphthalenovorans]
MNVHEAITNHTRKQHAHLERFIELENERERAIEQAVAQCAAGLPFSVEPINAVTALINSHAQKGISPTRIFVTEEMVREFVKRKG